MLYLCQNANNGSFLKWEIESLDCQNNQATIRFKNLFSMISDTSHTCTCALGSQSDIFLDISSVDFVNEGTNTPISSFANWQPDNTNSWNNSTGFDGNYNISGLDNYTL